VDRGSTSLSTGPVDNVEVSVEIRWTTLAVVHSLWTTLGTTTTLRPPSRHMTGPDGIHPLWIEEI